jgi:MFS family permease
MRSGFRELTPALRWFMIATVVNMTGTAMLFAFAFVYLDEVRGFSGRTSGLIMAIQPFAMVTITPLAGWCADRFGPRRMLGLGCVLSIIAAVGWSFVTTLPIAVAVSVIGGIGIGFWFPSQSALLALIVTPAQRPITTAFQRTALNLGAALGGALAGFIVDIDNVNTFHVLFAINAVTTVLFLLALPGLPSGKVDQHESMPGYRHVFADRFFIALVASDVAIALGFGFAFAVMPAYATKIGIDERTIGVLFGIGAIAVVFVQMTTLRWVANRDRMVMLALMNALFLVAFVFHGLSGFSSLTVAVLCIGVGQFIAGIGETFIAAVRQPFTADLAPDALMGRYYGLAGMVFQGSMGAASAVGGLLLDGAPERVWLVAGVVSAIGVAASLALAPAARRRLPGDQQPAGEVVSPQTVAASPG